MFDRSALVLRDGAFWSVAAWMSRRYGPQATIPMVDDLRLGRLLRAVRIRRGWRQIDVAERAEVNQATISRLERGQLEAVRLGSLRRVGRVLEVDLDIRARWRGGDGDRLLSNRHSALAEVLALQLGGLAWQVRPEVSFSIWGERGVIDLLAWHPAHRTVLVVELKTEIVDVGELLGTLDRKRRLAPLIARDLGLEPVAVAACVVILDGPTNRRRVAEHRTVLRAALPADGRRLRGWLQHPDGSLSALAFRSIPRLASGRSGSGGPKRVRRSSLPCVNASPRTDPARRGLAAGSRAATTLSDSQGIAE